MSSSAWIAIFSRAVAGGAAAGSWFLARGDQADLDAANAAIVGLENTNAGLENTKGFRCWDQFLAMAFAQLQLIDEQ